MLRQNTYLALCGGLLLGIVGCGEDATVEGRPETVPVTGIVTLGGTPVEGASVTFHSPAGQDADRPSAVGQTDAEGRFDLTTFVPQDGAVPGEYGVTITKYDVAVAAPAGGENPSEESADYVPPTPAQLEASTPKNQLPEKYAQAATTDQKAHVKAEGENEFTFALEN